MKKDSRKEIAEMIKKADVDGLLAIVSDLDTKTRNIVLKVIAENLDDKKKKLAVAEVRKVVQEADSSVRDWIVNGVGTAYVTGTAIADDLLATQKVKIGAKSLTFETLATVEDFAIHSQAVNALISDSYLDFASGMNGVVKGSERIFNEALKRQVRVKATQGVLSGQSTKEVAKEVRELLENQGFTVLLDRGGKQWTLEKYSDMLARTHLIKANNEGTINRAVEFDVDLLEVSTHGATDHLCSSQEGKIYSISGNTEGYEKLDGNNTPPFHPNCKHSLLPRPDLQE